MVAPSAFADTVTPPSFSPEAAAMLPDRIASARAGARLVVDPTDKTGSATYWRQIDAAHFEEVTTASPKVGNPEEHKAYELVSDETP